MKRGTTVRVERYEGVACWYANRCDVGHIGCVIVVAVGDDVGRHVDEDELTPLDEGDFCGGCGQIGCGHGIEVEE